VTRASRLAFGLVMIGGAVVLVLNTSAFAHGERVFEASWVPERGWWHAWQVIVATWIAASVASLPGLLIRDRGDRWRTASYVVPAIGVALLLPLTIHMPIFLKVDGAKAFDDWVEYSGIFVAAAHITFAVMVGSRARAIVEGREPVQVHTIYGVTVAMACVPGLIVVLPPLICAATGIPILPLLYLMERWGKRAREQALMPMAVARIAS
jgi:hypothetical protein